jgi:ABC-2 type transport system ATP-binding protein
VSATTPAKGAPVAVLEDAGRSFGARVVLEHLTLTVAGGELVALVGPNGGGKSTLLLLLAGLLRPTAGRVRVCGLDPTSPELRAAGRVGLVTARPGLYPLLTGRENLHHFGGLYGLTAEDIDARAAPLAKALNLERLDERVSRLSTGMQQKLSLIRALLLSPSLLLLDEPTANLDPLAARALHAEVRRRADEGLACVVVTHDLPAAEAICDRIVLLDRTVRRELTFTERRAPLTGPTLSAWQAALGDR